MKRAFLVIDNQPGFAALLKRIVEREWDSMRVDTYDPDDWGWPQEVDWKHYSVVLIASHMGEDDGLEWLDILRHEPHFPACVILGNSGEPDELDIRAKDLGAVEYLRKSMMSRERIITAVKQVIQHLKAKHLAQSEQQSTPPEAPAPAVIESSELSLAPLEPLAIAPSEEDANTQESASAPESSELSLAPLDTDPPEPATSTAKTAPAEETGQTSGSDTSPSSGADFEKMVEQSSQSDGPAVHTSKLRVDGYIIESKIAEGGMSGIYKCTREEDGKPAVLKTILARAEQVKKLKAIERSDLEFNVISRIHHPNVVRLYDHGRVEGFVYTTMEYFATGDLKERMKRGISQQQALSYMVQVAEGLNAIHGCGIIHRDLKPANIMFREDETLAILDFGIAKDITKKMDLTIKGMRLGTPSYMSPEQGNGGYKLDARSDLYSLGVMLYEMLSKKRPYTGRAPDVIKSHLYDPIPQLPGEFFEVQSILDRLMGKFPHDRFESAYDLTQFIRANYRYDTTLNFDFDPDGDFLSLDKDKNAHF